MSQPKVKKEVTISARYFIKKDCTSNGVSYKAGSVVYLCKNSDGVEYLCVVRPSAINSCNCKAGQNNRKCYHLTYCTGVENAREAAAEKTLAALALAKEVEAIVMEAEAICMEPTPAREIAPLNYRNQGFSLLRRSA